MTATEVEEAVQSGIRLLDKKFGTDFHEQINLDTLNISSGLSCALGQVYGAFSAGRNTLGLDFQGCVKHGFEGTQNSYDRLTEEWRKQLLARSA